MNPAPASAGPSILGVEAVLTLAMILVAVGWPRLGSGAFRRIERILGNLARKRVLAVVMIGVCACGLRALMLPRDPIPQPYIYDDFSYLLAGDTFASGRLTNPTHPMWTHFESFHITQVPSYMSMYFPAQGMVLAAGKVIAGHPWWGVWASAGLMCAAICWMLQGWLPPGWAFLGGCLAVLRIALFSYWVDQYWGGAVAAIGGALVLGALPRLRRSFRARDFFWMALGMGILANSRPYEGLLVTIPALIALGWWIAKKPHPSFAILIGRAAPAAALLLVIAGFIGYYNYRLFGRVLTTAYSASRAEYASAPHFLWQAERPEPAYRHEVMREFYSGVELSWFRNIKTPLGFFEISLRKLGIAIFFFFGAALAAPLVMLPRVLRDRRIRYFVGAGAFFGIGLFMETWLIPHYVAPFVAGVYVILLQCMRHMRAGRTREASPGFFLVRAIPAMCVALAMVRVYAEPLKIELPQPRMSTPFGSAPAGLARAKVLADFEKQSGGQLAIVRYAPEHDILDDWVYNAADIDRSKVVWAREMDSASNRDLLDYFKDRKAWLVEPDFNPPRISPYPEANVHELNHALLTINAPVAFSGARP